MADGRIAVDAASLPNTAVTGISSIAKTQSFILKRRNEIHQRLGPIEALEEQAGPSRGTSTGVEPSAGHTIQTGPAVATGQHRPSPSSGFR